MSKMINNPELLQLVGAKLGVKCVSEYAHFPEDIRPFMVAGNLDGERYVLSVIFNADSEPEIGLAEDLAKPDRVEFYRASALVFSAPSESTEPLPARLFHPDGRLIVSPLQKRPEAA